jgi:hypothetical protein
VSRPARATEIGIVLGFALDAIEGISGPPEVPYSRKMEWKSNAGRSHDVWADDAQA